MSSSLREGQPPIDIRIVPPGSIILQEKADPARAEMLAKGIKNLGVFQDPILTVPFPGTKEKLMQFDGATRHSAAVALGLNEVVVQVYPDYKKIHIESWAHHTIISEQELKRGLDKNLNLGLSAVEVNDCNPAVDLSAIALLFVSEPSEKYICVTADNKDIFSRLQALDFVFSLYEVSPRRSALHRPTHKDRLQVLEIDFHLTTLVEFPPLKHQEILEIVESGRKVPPGLTRHLPGIDSEMRLDSGVPYHLIHFEYPLELLDGKTSSDDHQFNVEALLRNSMPNDYPGFIRVLSWPEPTRDVIAKARAVKDA